MHIQARLCRGDLTAAYTGPVPVYAPSGQQVGTVIGMAFDGEYTVATVQVTDEEAYRQVMDRRVAGLAGVASQ